jgi:alpha-L-fucosidase 2
MFQMDANGGHPAAILVSLQPKDDFLTNSTWQNALIQAPDTPSLGDVLVISLLPALPASWSNGHLHGARIRRGLEIDIDWAAGALTNVVLRAARMVPGISIEVMVKGMSSLRSLTLERGMTVVLV